MLLALSLLTIARIAALFLTFPAANYLAALRI